MKALNKITIGSGGRCYALTLVTWLLLQLSPTNTFSQFQELYCGTLDKGSYYGFGGSRSSSSSAHCHDEAVTKVVNINIHFLLDGSGGGNYTETQGLNGDSYNGIAIANDIVEAANWLMANNNQLFQPIGNTTPVESVNIQWELRGVHFDDDLDAFTATRFNFRTRLEDLHVNSTSEINVYFTTSNIEASGVASGLRLLPADNVVLIGNFNWFEDNIRHPVLPFRFKIFWFADLLNHEIGHLLSLSHPFRVAPGSDCTNTNPDACADTYTFCNPSRNDQVGNACFYPLFPITNPYDGRFCTEQEYSNTFMDYNVNHKAISPCQIERMHDQLCDGNEAFFTECEGNSLLVFEQGSSIPSGTQYSSGIILASGDVNGSGTTNLHAGVAVNLLPGFQTFTGPGDVFNAAIEDCQEITLARSLGLQNQQGEVRTLSSNQLTVYPNPASGILTLDCSALKENLTYQLEIYDSSGRIVYDTKVNNQTLKFGLPRTGLYLMKVIQMDNGLVVASQRIVYYQ